MSRLQLDPNVKRIFYIMDRVKIGFRFRVRMGLGFGIGLGTGNFSIYSWDSFGQRPIITSHFLFDNLLAKD